MREAALDCLLMFRRLGNRADCRIADRPGEPLAPVEHAVFGIDGAGVIVGRRIGARRV